MRRSMCALVRRARRVPPARAVAPGSSSPPTARGSLEVSCPRCWTSSSRCSCWSSSRRSTSAACSSRGAARRRSGTPIWRRPASASRTSGTSRRSTRRRTSSSGSPRPRAAARSAATRSRSAPPRPARRARRRAAARTRRSSAARAAETDRAQHDPFGSQVPDHSVVHRYARCLSYPEWGVGEVAGIYFTGGGDDIQQWARVRFQPGVRTVPADSLQFVDFSTPDPGAERVQRFVTAAQHALAEGDFALAARRLIYARDADPRNAVGAAADDARVLAGRRPSGGRPRGPRLGARRGRPPRAAPLRRAHLRGHGRHRAGRGGGDARRRARARRTPTPGSGSAGCACG